MKRSKSIAKEVERLLREINSIAAENAESGGSGLIVSEDGSKLKRIGWIPKELRQPSHKRKLTEP
jgi:hypothetical protein